MSCFYILDINLLSVTSFTNIFSHSVGHLLILLMVSFYVQKILSLIWSHLFIFKSFALGGWPKKILLLFMSRNVFYVLVTTPAFNNYTEADLYPFRAGRAQWTVCMPLEQWFFSLASHPMRSIFKNRPVEPISEGVHPHWHLLKLQDRERERKKKKSSAGVSASLLPWCLAPCSVTPQSCPP